MPAGDRSTTAVTNVTNLAPAESVGRYDLLEQLGSGGMADVYLALAKGPFDAKKLVVLKRPRSVHHESAEMFMDEARLAMRLNHPNVVQTYEVGVDGGAFFLAMEFLEGQPLHRVLQAVFAQAVLAKGTPLLHAHLARMVGDTLAGLHYAHELRDYDGTPLQIVHRDVSPQNVFVTYDGQIKVVDFGIAKATMNEVLTQMGNVKGKLAYMAPEQANGGVVDRRADVFVCGIILWEMIARRRLVTGRSSSELMHSLLSLDFPPLSCEVPDVHPVLEAIAMRALQRDPRDRYATALEMRDALESYIAMASHPVRAHDIGRVVSGLFSTAREQMSSRIRVHMQGAGRAPSGENAVAPQPLPLPQPQRGMATAVTDIVGGQIGGRALPVGAPTGGSIGASAAPPVAAHGGDTMGTAVVTPRPARSGGQARMVASLVVLAIAVVALAGALLVTVRSLRERKETSATRPTESAEVAVTPAPTISAPETVAVPSSAVVPPTLTVEAPRQPTRPPRTPTGTRRDRGEAAGSSPTGPKRPIDTSFPK